MTIPKDHEFFPKVMESVQDGKEHSIAEIKEYCVTNSNFTKEQLDQRYPKSGDFVLLDRIGWAIAGLSTVGGIIAASFMNKNKLKEVESHIDTIKRDNDNMEPKLQHLSELIERSENNYNNRLMVSLKWLSDVRPKNYQEWDDEQKHELERLINVVSYTVQLINERV